MLVKNTLSQLFTLPGSSKGFPITTILQQCILSSLNHVFKLQLDGGFHVNLTMSVRCGICCGLLTGDIWCERPCQTRWPIHYVSKLSFRTRDGNTWELLMTCWVKRRAGGGVHFCCLYFMCKKLFMSISAQIVRDILRLFRSIVRICQIAMLISTHTITWTCHINLQTQCLNTII